ncbi:hypothetical protein EVG20_g5788 [Dentipellis fragilis]|uniref:Transport and Golgi organization protein 2 n=1 Tax=Dentipellis fragilis TaxID=205917 RepID=A0A4Y9YRW5_9AGAM|nr:hypothetical protein EVG20_g5788 [Dentipellis fragilis]
MPPGSPSSLSSLFLSTICRSGFLTSCLPRLTTSLDPDLALAMCVAIWSLTHPAYALILCSNRDEYLARPTEPAHFHSFGPLVSASAPAPHTDPGHSDAKPEAQSQSDAKRGENYVLSGRDILAGGTWLGINRSGRLALLTNITEPYAHYDSSRGTLLSDFLLAPRGESLDEYVAELESQETVYAGFNLLLLSPTTTTNTKCVEHPASKAATLASDPASSPTEPSSKPTLAYTGVLVTNSGGGRTPLTVRPLREDECNCGGLSNGVDGHGADAWPKVINGVYHVQEALERMDVGHGKADVDEEEEEKLVEELMNILSTDPAIPPTTRHALRTAIHVSPLALEPLSGPAGPYGTRLSTVVLVRRDGRVLFVERDIWMLDETGKVVKGGKEGERVWRFHVDASA